MTTMLKRIFQVFVFVFLTFTTSFSQKTQKIKDHYIYDNDTIIRDKEDHIYVIKNLGENVNSYHVESGPKISPDGKELYFFRVNHPQNIKGTRDIWVSTYNEADSTWGEAEHLPEPLNCHGDNSVHWISPDGNKMLVHNEYLKNGTTKNGMSFTYRDRKGKWSMPEPLKVKHYKNDAVCSFDLNNEGNVLFLNIHYKDSYGNQDLYVSFLEDNGKTWTEPMNLGPMVNTEGSEATSFLASDNMTLYFSSNGRADSKGGFDIYKTVRQDSTWTNWSKPVNMGSPYNTPDDEFYFSIPEKGDYVYLAHHFEGTSDSLPHSDIVRIKLKQDPVLTLSGFVYDEYTKEKIPAHITFKQKATKEIVHNQLADSLEGYKVELKSRHVYEVIIAADGYQTYTDTVDVTRLKKDSERNKDFYIKRIPSLVLSGLVKDEKTQEPIGGEVVFYRISDGKEVFRKNTEPGEEYSVKLPAGDKYRYEVTKKGYIFKDNSQIDLTQLKTFKEETRDIFLTQMIVGGMFELKDIYFETAKATLLPESFVELDNLYEIMIKYPEVSKVEISGHTDWVGSDTYNKNLSQRRAQSVVSYLTNKKGIALDRIVAKGYGEEKPIADNNTEEGRQQNRRVEFTILEITQ